MWLYYFPSQRQITLHCLGTDNQMPHSLILEGTGLVHGATTCHISLNDIQLLPELHGTTQVKLDFPNFILPDNISIASEHEIQQLKDITPAEIQKLDDICSRVTAPWQTYDLDLLLHVHHTTELQEKGTHRFMTIFLSLCTTTIFGILCYLIYPHLRTIQCTSPKSDTTNPPPNISSEPHEPQREEQSQKVLFTLYPLQ